MVTVILVVHLLLAIAMVGLILMQRSEGGALGMGGGGGGGMGGFMSGRATADLLTRSTAILATGFFCTSLVLAIISGHSGESKSILDQPAPVVQQPVVPSGPSAPVAQ